MSSKTNTNSSRSRNEINESSIIYLSFSQPRGIIAGFAGVAQLVEHHLAKVDVEGSNPFARSISNHDLEEFANFPLK